MQQATAASFFPTAKELSSGVQWFKDHPVLAAAAATAVSVITYLNALELPAEEAATRHRNTSRPASIRRRGSPSLSRKSSGALASDGKLSAAVSWCDEHGGSLTQVFEDETPPPLGRRARRLEDSESDGEDGDDVAESFQDAFQRHRTLRKSVTTQQLDAGTCAAAASDSEADTAQTESPQWGWYVPITPPQDQFHPTGRESAVVAPRPADEPTTDVMRRTTSGHIP